ncbi:MAG: phosphoribosylglycinamide formyltransferase [Fluviicola sp.]|nr:MAG: phosphoribosylglycinamide formyltransferase [Fluviicola sp.]
MRKHRLAIFASGNGSNAVRLIDYFENHESIETPVVLTNNKNAGVIERLENTPVKTLIIDNKQADDGECLINLMRENEIDFIVLGGYLRKIPAALISIYQDKIINIHPALLPKYGGKGMYGIHVHQAVKEANEPETGITIHLVNQNYDEGRILAQHMTSLSQDDNTIDIQRKVQGLEHEWFPKEIEKYIDNISK